MTRCTRNSLDRSVTHPSIFSSPAGLTHVQVWFGTGLGFFICLAAAGGLIGGFYTAGVNKWEVSEYNYEGAFSLIAAVIITIIGAALLRIGKMQEKWRLKLATALEAPVSKGQKGRLNWFKRFAERYAMFALPFITVLREGIEAIVFVAGVSFSAPATAVPLPVVVGLLAGIVVGYLLYKFVILLAPACPHRG
jgi:high-affinity iron transporter